MAKSKNNISDKEMINTFNCGVGFCLIIDKKILKKIINAFQKIINLTKLAIFLKIKKE